MRAELLMMINAVQDYVSLGLIIFVVVNLINVMLSTMKSILTVKSTRLVATLINAVSYGFYALIVKQMADYDITTVVVVTIVANLIGVYSSMWILDKFKKDKLWKVTVITQTEDAERFKADLITNELSFNELPIMTKYGKTTAFDIFSSSQLESAVLREVLRPYEKVKYHVLEVGKGL
jgi:uncharacterized protein YebE (UPF0316 family)